MRTIHYALLLTTMFTMTHTATYAAEATLEETAEALISIEQTPVSPRDRMALIATMQKMYDYRQTLIAAGDAAIPLLQRLLSDERPAARVEAIKVLCAIGTPATLPLMVTIMASDADASLKCEALRVMGRLSAREDLDTQKKELIRNQLLTAMNHDETCVRTVAAESARAWFTDLGSYEPTASAAERQQAIAALRTRLTTVTE